MQYFFSFFLGMLNAFVCAHYAKKRGRNGLYWFIGGAFFGLFALGTLFLLPSRKAKSAGNSAQAAPPPIPLLNTIVPEHSAKLWYYLDEGKKQCGPMSFDALGKAWNEQKLDIRSLVWNEDLDNWKCFDEVIRVETQVKT